MKSNTIFITAAEWFESTSLRNPISSMDYKLERFFPECYSVSYDTKLLATKEQRSLFRNDYREQFAQKGIHAIESAIVNRDARYVFLNGFDQEHFLCIAPKLKDSAEIIYFFKCSRIYDLSPLSEFTKLKCVHIYWNNSLERLWDMTGNQQLKVISCIAISKLSNIESLKQSCVEYVCLDSSDNDGNEKRALFPISVFEEIPHLKHLLLVYSDCKIDY